LLSGRFVHAARPDLATRVAAEVLVPTVLHFAIRPSTIGRVSMKTKNALTVRPTPALSELKRARDLIRITERILGKSIAPGRNRTDEQGRKQGHWVEQDAYGNVFEGSYVDGKQHGHWVERFADGVVFEGAYVDDKQHGHWVERWADVGVWEGPYVDGKKHGDWVLRYADGSVWEGPYVDDKQHGHWVYRFADGDAWKGQFVNGERHGRWVSREPNGTEAVTHWHYGEIVK